MSLHDLLEDLAADAPLTGAPPQELWRRGRRAARVRRLGTIAIVAAACLGLLALTGVSWQTRTAPAPSSSSGHAPAMPDRLYRPSGWLPSYDGAPGVLAAVMPVCRNTLLGSRPGLVGVSATTGRYGFLKLPHASLSASGEVLAPDGHAVAFWTSGAPTGTPHDFSRDHSSKVPSSLGCFRSKTTVNGFAVYDTTTGRTTYTRLSSPHGVAPRQLAWADDGVVYASYGHLTLRAGTRGSWAAVQGMSRPSDAVLSDLSRITNTAPAGHGRLLVDDSIIDRHGKPLHGQSTHTLIDLATGARRPFTSTFLTSADMATTPSTAVVSPDGGRSAYPVGTAGRIGIARLDGAAPTTAPATKLGQAATSRARGISWVTTIGWIDEDHVAVVVGQNGGQHPIETVQVVGVADLSVTGAKSAVRGIDRFTVFANSWLAYDLLARPTFHAQRPPSPLGLRTESGVGAGVVVIAAAAIVLWRRRARP